MVDLAEVGDSTFQQEVLESQLPIVVDFWAEWCGPCKMVDAALGEFTTEYAGQVRFVKLNVDDHYESAARYGVQSLPTLIVFRGGREVHRIIGAAPRGHLKRQLDRALGVAA